MLLDDVIICKSSIHQNHNDKEHSQPITPLQITLFCNTTHPFSLWSIQLMTLDKVVNQKHFKFEIHKRWSLL